MIWMKKFWVGILIYGWVIGWTCSGTCALTSFMVGSCMEANRIRNSFDLPATLTETSNDGFYEQRESNVTSDIKYKSPLVAPCKFAWCCVRSHSNLVSDLQLSLIYFWLSIWSCYFEPPACSCMLASHREKRSCVIPNSCFSLTLPECKTYTLVELKLAIASCF